MSSPAFLRRLSRFTAALVSCWLLATPADAADPRRTGATETALDRYVAAPDPAYRWQLAATAAEAGVTVFSIDLVSQRWLTPEEVSQPEWRHWLTIVRPDNLAHSTALLLISGGSNPADAPPKPGRPLLDIARATRSVVAELRMIPNQPLVFHGDGVPRKEDDLIAYTWKHFLRTGDERWPARLPMTKAAVRAMDTVTAFLASDAGGNRKVDTFTVAGGSKRGWTTWAAAGVDRRVTGIAPLVIDVLNVEASITHHFRAYGYFAPAVGDYSRHNIMDWFGTPESRALNAIEDPYFYRDRLTLPKLMLNAAGDQFFLPDSSRFYFADLPGPKFLRYIPNTDHSLRNSDSYETVAAWHHALLNRTPLPEFSWSHDAQGALVVRTTTKPLSATLWQATNPKARDFRLESIGPIWKSTPLAATGETFTAAVEKPAAGWTAYFVELAFDLGAPTPLKLTTAVTVTPDTLPFPAPVAAQPKGFLSK
jgi:PhoPQ-activated pathogenicity-related protein